MPHRRPNERSGRAPHILLALSRYHHRMHLGVNRYAAEHGWHLNAEMTVTGVIPEGWQGDGIITLLGERKDVASLVRRARVPAVDLSIVRTDIPLPRVTGDHAAIGRLAAEHFLERAFRNFAWYSETIDPVTSIRLAAYRERLAAEGHRCEVWQWPHDPLRAGVWRAMSRRLAQRLRAASRPLALFASRDLDAVRVLDVCLAESIRVPEEVAILGVDNNQMICESLRVPLSSVNHDHERIGYEGAALLDSLLRGARPPAGPIVIPPQGITARRSTEVLAINVGPVRRAMVHLLEHFGDRTLGMADVVRAAGVSRRALELGFRRELGTTPHAELVALRIRSARDLLARTDLRVRDVAARCGFSTVNYFVTVFRRSTGQTPRRYRVRSRH